MSVCAFWTAKRIKSSCFLLSSDWNWFKRMDDFVFLCYFVSIFTTPHYQPILLRHNSFLFLLFLILCYSFLYTSWIVLKHDTCALPSPCVHSILLSFSYCSSCLFKVFVGWVFFTVVRPSHLLHTFNVPFFVLTWKLVCSFPGLI